VGFSANCAAKIFQDVIVDRGTLLLLEGTTRIFLLDIGKFKMHPQLTFFGARVFCGVIAQPHTTLVDNQGYISDDVVQVQTPAVLPKSKIYYSA